MRPGPLPLVIVPVFNALEHVKVCLLSIHNASPHAPVLVIDDGSTDEAVRTFLQSWAAQSDRHELQTRAINKGFVATVNQGMRHSGGDVILLNSDTQVSRGWFESLGRCLAEVSDIATATPWTNNGEIASFPKLCESHSIPEDLDAIARVFRASGPPEYPEIPTAVGFCMAISRSAIDRVGLFDEKIFGRGYGEENDFSLRAASAGMHNVLCDDAYVAHRGQASFGPLGLAPGPESMQRLLERHPGYLDMISAYIEQDPLAPRRQVLATALHRSGVKID